MANSYREYLKMKKYGGEGGDTPSPTLISKTISANGLYLPEDDQADGYNSVSVNVPEVSDIAFVPPQKFKSNGSNLEDYKIFGSDGVVTETETSVLPLTFTTVEDKLRDWTIYGNDEPGTENLFNPNAFEFVKTGAILNDNGEEQASPASGYTAPFIDVVESTIYRLDGELSGYAPESGAANGYRVYYYNNSTFLSRSNVLGNNTQTTFTTPANCNKLAIQCQFLNNYPHTDTVMLTKGSTPPSTYIPYQQGVGQRTENLFDKDATDTNNGYVLSQVLNDDGTMRTAYTGWATSEYISINEGSYTFVGVQGVYPSICWYDQSKQYIGGVAYGVSTKINKTVSLPSGAKYVRFSFILTEAPNIMLVKGSTAPSSYVPFGYQIPISCEHSMVGAIKVGYYSSTGFNPSTTSRATTEPKYLATGTYKVNIPSFVEAKILKRIADGKEAAASFISSSTVTISTAGDYTVQINTTNALTQAQLAELDSAMLLSDGNDYTFYIDSPLTAGQSISKTSTGVDIATVVGENTISSTLYNKPETSVTYAASGGVGEKVSGSYVIPVKINSTTTNVPIGDTPLMEDEYVSYAEQKIYRYVEGTLTPVDPPSALPQIATANGVNELSVDTDVQPELVQIGLGIPVELIPVALGTKTITTNDTYDASDDSLDGYSSVTVNVQPNVGTKTITANDTYDASDDGLDGYSSVTVNVPEKVLTTKTITASGTYNAVDDQADGYSSVTVNVRPYSEVLDQGLQAVVEEEE